ncbi:hypothetical protein [Pseudomonas ovata]|uniref:hypothetical protein n=1 Tax=Pseudomonas ovata TaxID=1839709 RepID=UPI000D6986A1|nr:hypothetical protein [Pseudomonas ovata]
MLTEYMIIRPDGTEETHAVDLPQNPAPADLNAVIIPFIGTSQSYERAAVLFEGKRADMFVSEVSQFLPPNPSATAIYRNNTLTAHPETSPESLPYVGGTVVLFKRRVCS